MYWLYLILFILMVITPDLIDHSFWYLNEERMEELVILILGILAFIIFLLREKQLMLQLKEKKQIQREASLASRDLTDTYSYIGEINRKMDILKDIALGLSEETFISAQKEQAIYRSIIHAVQMFSKSTQVSILFINVKTGQIVKEIKNNKKVKCGTINGEIFQENKNFMETEESFFIHSPKAVDNIAVCIAIKKRNRNQKIDDPSIIKALASQALFLFTFSRKIKNHSRSN